MTELSLFDGDPFNRLMGRLGLGRDRPHWAARRAVTGWVLTWVVLAALSAASGLALGPTLREKFLIDFAAYGQFWVAVPLFLLAEPGVDRHLANAVRVFATSGLIRPEEAAGFETAIRSANGTKAWWAIDVVLLAATFGMGLTWLSDELGNGSGSWHARLGPGGETLTLPGWWLLLVGIPVFNYLLLRWVYKLAVWFHVLWRVSRLDLKIIVGHPDQAGGLGFLGDLQSIFGMLIFAVGSTVASTVGYKITIEKSSALTAATAGPIVAFVVLAPVAFLAPLLFFTAQLYWAKVRGLVGYTLAAGRYAQAFEARWVSQSPPPAEEFLGTGDIQSFADLGTVFESVRSMRIFPFDVGTVIRLILTAAGPMLPLLAKFFPQMRPLLDFLG